MAVEASTSAAPQEAFKTAAREISQQISSADALVSSALDRLESTDELNYRNGISLLSAKNDTLLSYLQHMAVLMLARLEGEAVPQAAVKELVRDRVVLEKMRPLESKLRYQVEKLLRKAESAAAHAQDGPAEDLDPLSFRPNPEALMSARDGPASGSEDSEEEDERQAGEASQSGGVYRPPRVAPMPYVEGSSRSKKSKGRDAPTSGFLTDLARDLTTSANTPYAEGVSGLSTAPNANSKRARKLAEIKEYEEGNLTRLSMSKKESKQRRADEEEVALGGGGSLDARGRGGRGGFGVEVDELLASIDRKGGDGSQRGRRSKQPGAEYDELRKYRAERQAVPAESVQAGGKRKSGKGQFEAALQREAKRSKRSSKK